jgi:NAD(P)-dependent dehydrogenase (short-subunit alcohol dehydrogenase family)
VPVVAPVTVITGGSRGIGLHIARALAGQGHRLLLVARDGQRLAAAAAGLGGAVVETLAVDLRHPDAPARVIAHAHDRLGGCDVVVNNAGSAPAARIEQTTDADLAEVLDLHLRVPFALARLCAESMRRRGSGCLLQIASSAGLRGFAFTSAYTAAKHAMVGLSRALHAELRPAGIDVYAVCPGFVDTDITRAAAAAVAARGKTTVEQALSRMAALNRIGRMHAPAEVADAVVHLVRDRPAGCVYDLDRPEPAFVD